MKSTKAVKDLLIEYPGALQLMHISEGFDYEKEVFIFEGEGPLSPENLKSTIGNTLQGESSRTSWHAVLLAKQSGRDHTTAPTFYVKYAVVSGNIVPLPFSKRTRFPETFEYVERKEGCDYLRLLKSVRYYIVLQDKSLLCKEKKTIRTLLDVLSSFLRSANRERKAFFG